jgi:hypothetical protein
MGQNSKRRRDDKRRRPAGRRPLTQRGAARVTTLGTGRETEEATQP